MKRKMYPRRFRKRALAVCPIPVLMHDMYQWNDSRGFYELHRIKGTLAQEKERKCLKAK